MSLLTKPVVIEKTKEELKVEVSANITREIQLTYNQLVQKYNEMMKRFWENPKGLTPQEICDGLGNDAAYLFQYGGALATLITTINPNETKLMIPKNAFTINQNGTVTISDQPYQP